MKYCQKCGNELYDEAVICPKCGCATGNGIAINTIANNAAVQQNNVATQNKNVKITGLQTAAKVFMIISTIVLSLCCFLIPLAWCLPMTISYSKAISSGKKVSTGFKVCSLIFVNTVAGILMLCDND